jgi:hypothetical protein
MLINSASLSSSSLELYSICWRLLVLVLLLELFTLLSVLIWVFWLSSSGLLSLLLVILDVLAIVLEVLGILLCIVGVLASLIVRLLVGVGLLFLLEVENYSDN